MNNFTLRSTLVCLALVAPAAARPDLISNGGFETGFAGWTRADQVGGSGTFHDQSGSMSPVNLLSVASPTEGLHAAMTDSDAPGGHALYQDIFIPLGQTQGTLNFSLYINNTASAFSVPATLDWSTPTLNQQARVDLMSAAADPFSTASADIFQNAFQTTIGSPLVTGYNAFSIDITALVIARGGQTIRLRFAETDNVNIFNFGVDAVSLVVVPAPAAALLLAPVCVFRVRARRNT